MVARPAPDETVGVTPEWYGRLFSGYGALAVEGLYR
jgi:hypothetical protein